MDQNIFKKLKEIVPKNGIVFNEKNEFSEILCKPKLLPLKSVNIKKLESLEKEFEKANNEMALKNK
jgi:BBSome-interacting protein 1